MPAGLLLHLMVFTYLHVLD